jgi:predicted PhzF superfamily epimerase YddE/YHI9
MQRRYITVDVFTDRAFGGNPLAVILDAGGLSTAQRMANCHCGSGRASIWAARA